MTNFDTLRSSYRGLAAGTSLNGIYAIDQMIGAGGMGEVYKGHEVQTGATVAIKMLLPEMAENEAALALFRREASALLNLHHDAIVRYFLFTVEPTLQRPYLAMEFIDGRSLSDILAGGALPYGDVVKLIRRVASGFHVAHERGLVHRDVSPDNIIVSHGGLSGAKIIDFGIARFTAVGDPTIIGDGFAGKHNYVSPEQVGLFGHEVTFKSDIYSFGLVLYNAITGHKLDMGGSQFQLVEKRRRVPDLNEVDVRLRPLLERMLQPNPNDRPASMAEISAWPLPDEIVAPPNLELIKPTANLRENSASPARPHVRKKATWLNLAVALAAIAIVGGGTYGYYVLVWSDGASKPATAPPRLTPPATIPKPQAEQTAKPAPATEPGKQATLPPQTTPIPQPPNRLARIRTYLEQYNGGECFTLVPVAISQNAAIVEGFGSSTAAFDTFAQAFRTEQGFDASVGIRQITTQQCAALRFINELHSDRARSPRINLDAIELKSGDALSGTIENISDRVLEFLLITDNGQVQNLTSMLKPGTDSMSFQIGLQKNQPGVVPQLLVAIASSRALSSLRIQQSVAADILFPQTLKEANASNATITASARYFKLEK